VIVDGSKDALSFGRWRGRQRLGESGNVKVEDRTGLDLNNERELVTPGQKTPTPRESRGSRSPSTARSSKLKILLSGALSLINL
jgi:hypothetical protein